MDFQPTRLPSYDKESILKEIRRVVNQHFIGRCPSTLEFVKHSRVSVSPIIRQFGSWPAAMAAAGFVYSRSRVSQHELIDDLRRILRSVGGKYFSQREYSAKGGRFSVKTLKVRLGCGTWRDLLNKYLAIQPIRRVIVVRKSLPSQRGNTKEELLEELLRVWRHLGRRPKYSEFEEHARFGVRSYERRFGSWKSAIAEAIHLGASH